MAVRRVSIRNYKSIERATVDLGPLLFLSGRNGAGKSNFLDALRFVSNALDLSLEQALRDRGGIDSVRRIARGHPRNFAIRLDLNLYSTRATATYAFEIGSERNGGFVVKREECRVTGSQGQEDFFSLEGGRLKRSSRDIPTLFQADRLNLATISGLPEFRPVYDRLRRMHFFSFNPERIRDLQDPDPGRRLERDGRNLAAFLREIGKTRDGTVLAEIREHLKAIVPGVVSVEPLGLGPTETLEFRQMVAGDPNPWRFMATSLSDGTLRALGILAATLGAGPGLEPVSLVGFEEPETALHPGAAEIVTEVLLLASRTVQILVTTHSPEILDHKGVQDRHLLAVTADRGRTVVAPIGKVARSALRDHLYTPGELLSMGQLEPDSHSIEASTRQLSLFSGGVE